MAKMKINFDFKKFFLEKGEKIGLGVGAAALALLGYSGVMAGISGDSAEARNKTITAKIQEKRNSLQNGSEVPDDPGRELQLDPKMRTVASREYPVDGPFFDPAGNIVEKRMRPRILPVSEAQAEFVRGSLSVYDIIGEKGNEQIAVLVNKERTQNNIRDVKSIGRRLKQQAAGKAPEGKATTLPPPVRPRPNTDPNTPNGQSPNGQQPNGPQVLRPNGGRVNIFGGQGDAKSEEKDIQYVSVNSDELEKYRPAITLMPKRMVVVTGSVPYKKQIEEFQRALRMRSAADLAADPLGAPLYFGMNVERMATRTDGTVEEEWRPLDFVRSFEQIYPKLSGLEPEDTKLKDLIPAPEHRLVQPRPRLMRGRYDQPSLETLNAALEGLRKNGPPAQVTPRRNRIQGGTADIFNPNSFGGSGPSAGGADAPPPAMGAPAEGGPRDRMGAGGTAAPSNATLAESWMLRFIDMEIEPGLVYRYRIQLRAGNPNFGLKSGIASPSIAHDEMLMSDWFEVPGSVTAPPEAFLYATGERMGGGADAEKTKLTFHIWYPAIRPEGFERAEPLGEWVLGQIDARRGQYVRESTPMLLPIWSMVQEAFIFRERKGAAAKPLARGAAQQPNVKVEFSSDWLLVDFEGGEASQLVHKKTVRDRVGVDVLLMGPDGKLICRNSATDLGDKDLLQRSANWLDWLQSVRSAMEEKANGGGNGANDGGRNRN